MPHPGTILAHYGRWVPLEKLRVDCGISRDGSNAASVLSAAGTYGLVAEGYKMEPESFDQMRLPCIVFWEFNHFLVVEGFSRGRAYLNDPASGRRTVTDEEFDRSFSGITLTFEPGPQFKKGGRRSSVVASLARRLRGVRMAVSFCVLAGLGLVIPGLAVPTFSKIFVDDILIGGSSRWLGPLLLGMAVAAVLRAALSALQHHYLMRSATKLAISTSGRFLWHVLRLPIEFFMQRYAAEVSNRITSNQSVATVLTGDLATSIIGLITAFFFALLMLSYDVVLTVIGVSISLVNLVLLRLIARKRADESQRMIQESGKLIATAMGGVQCIETIKASARESDFFARWAGYQAKSSAAEQRLAASTAFLNTVPMTLTLVSTAVVLGVGGFRVMDGALTIGMLVAFQTLLVSFSRPINDLVRMGALIQRLTGDMKRLDDVANYQLDQLFAGEPSGPPVAPERRLSGFLELVDVTFGYNRLNEPLLENFVGLDIALITLFAARPETHRSGQGVQADLEKRIRADGIRACASHRHFLKRRDCQCLFRQFLLYRLALGSRFGLLQFRQTTHQLFNLDLHGELNIKGPLLNHPNRAFDAIGAVIELSGLIEIESEVFYFLDRNE